MSYSKKHIVDPVLISKRMRVVMHWNNIGRKELQRELNYGDWYFDRMMAGIESPDAADMRKLKSMFGETEMNWLLGLSDYTPPWLST